MPTQAASKKARPLSRTAGAASQREANLERRLRFAEMLLGISQKVSGVDSLETVLETLVEVTAGELDGERGTLFLNDPQTNELYSRYAQGHSHRELRLPNSTGVAGHVFTTGESTIVHDVRKDPRFSGEVDKQTGFVTRCMVCVPLRTAQGEIIGVSQVLNKKRGRFTQADLELLTAMAVHCTLALQSVQSLERMKQLRQQEKEFLDVVAEFTSEIDIRQLLRKVMSEATRMLNAERSTLFLNDDKTGELWSEVGEGLKALQIRLPNTAGIAGAAFSSGQTINIPYAYADLRFNPAIDRQTGFFTRSILCVPITNPGGKIIGVTQVLNKRGGPFSAEDEGRLRAFTAQIAIALENAKLFSDVQNVRNYNESILQSMSSAVLTLDTDRRIVTCNNSGLRMFKARASDIVGRMAADLFGEDNTWLIDKLARVEDSQQAELTMDAQLKLKADARSVNLTVAPLVSTEKKRLGSMLMIEDISSEKRMKSTMARYMDPAIADQLLASGAELLGGRSVQATVLFSDIRGFTTLTEELGPQGTVSLLNEYFEIMVDCIQREGGMLDKFIGDAIMAAFGIPVPHEDDEDRAVRAGVAMLRRLREWNAGRVAEGKRAVDMGIGLNTDTVVSGNIGSNKRMDFTIIGDGVNLAARLETACKQYASRMLISEMTVKRLRGTYRMREIDFVVVKGKTRPVPIYEVLEYHDEESFPHLMEVVGHFGDGLAKYRAARWDAAAAAFAEALRLNPADRLSQIYADRCSLLKAHPPEGAWEGVWVLDEK